MYKKRFLRIAVKIRLHLYMYLSIWVKIKLVGKVLVFGIQILNANNCL